MPDDACHYTHDACNNGDYIIRYYVPHENYFLFYYLKVETFEDRRRINIKTIKCIIMINLTQEEINAMPDFMPVVGYEGLYEVGKDGSVWSLNYQRTGQRRELKQSVLNKHEYLFVGLCKGGKGKGCLVHQLVLNAYLPKPSEELEVMHINSKGWDNRLENLAWGTHIENLNDPHHTTLMSDIMTNHPYLSTRVLCIETGTVYPSTQEAERQTGIKRPSISNCINGKRKTAGGFHWVKVAENQ